MFDQMAEGAKSPRWRFRGEERNRGALDLEAGVLPPPYRLQVRRTRKEEGGLRAESLPADFQGIPWNRTGIREGERDPDLAALLGLSNERLTGLDYCAVVRLLIVPLLASVRGEVMKNRGRWVQASTPVLRQAGLPRAKSRGMPVLPARLEHFSC